MKYTHRKIKKNDPKHAYMPHVLTAYGDDMDRYVSYPFQELNTNIREWCNENFGERGKEWDYGSGYKNKVVFYFTSKDYVIAFKMMWLS